MSNALCRDYAQTQQKHSLFEHDAMCRVKREAGGGMGAFVLCRTLQLNSRQPGNALPYSLIGAVVWFTKNKLSANCSVDTPA
jgi:hypothetical protein